MAYSLCLAPPSKNISESMFRVINIMVAIQYGSVSFALLTRIETYI